ncbi:pyruvate kinase [Aquisphaera insulae]|uniref:pyruvate kinase n=1 Tax=Aquisphaera insulae TaxID=2712864 RepID=UPI0013E9D090|nr:pyruvate kinase [Aquisphaera insulae]
MTDSFLEPLGQVRTKIVATLGPASRSPEMIRKLINAGVDVFRLNFSHGTHDDHTESLTNIRRISDEMQRQVCVLQDLCGPKIRLGDLPGGAVECDFGAEFRLSSEQKGADDPHELSCTYKDLPDDLEVGQAVLFADGTVGMEVTAKGEGWAQLKVTLPGRIRSHQGINVPSAALSVEALTEKDLADLDWTATHSVGYVGLSFVRRPEDVTRLRHELEKRGCRARIVAKIEKPQAVANLEAIVDVTDAVMVARGDLGVEIDVEKVPTVQKQIIDACRKARVPVITATQMLNSMETSSRPTRAEASDVFNAVLDGTDAVMLSGETAIGEYPVAAVSTMSKICREAEHLIFSGNPGGIPFTCCAVRGGKKDGETGAVARVSQVLPVTDAIVDAASTVSRRLKAALMVVATHSGRTALAVSKHRNASPTLALTDDVEVARAMSLYWGVTPLHIPELFQTGQVLAFADEWCRTHDLINSGDHLVIVRGVIPNNPNHNALLVHEVE